MVIQTLLQLLNQRVHNESQFLKFYFIFNNFPFREKLQKKLVIIIIVNFLKFILHYKLSK
jgi:hypothetical protein